jgi:hypothetical protein
MKYYSLCVCVCSLSYPGCKAHAPYSNLWLHHVFVPDYLVNDNIFGKTLLNLKCVFRFRLQVLPEKFLILRIIQGGIVINVHTSLCKVQVTLVRFE